MMAKANPASGAVPNHTQVLQNFVSETTGESYNQSLDSDREFSWCTMCHPQNTMHNKNCTMFSVQCRLPNNQFVMKCPISSEQCTMHNEKCTMHNRPCTMPLLLKVTAGYYIFLHVTTGYYILLKADLNHLQGVLHQIILCSSSCTLFIAM